MAGIVDYVSWKQVSFLGSEVILSPFQGTKCSFPHRSYLQTLGLLGPTASRVSE